MKQKNRQKYREINKQIYKQIKKEREEEKDVQIEKQADWKGETYKQRTKIIRQKRNEIESEIGHKQT